MAWSRSARLPGAPEPGLQRGPEVGHVPEPVRVTGRGGGDGLPEMGDGLVKVCRLPGVLEPGPPRVPEVEQHRAQVGIVGRSGGDSLLKGGDGLVQVCLLPGALEPGPQRGPEVGQHRGSARVVSPRCGDGLMVQGDGLVQVYLLAGALEPGLQRVPEVGQHCRSAGVVSRGGIDRAAEEGDGVLEQLDVASPFVLLAKGSRAGGGFGRVSGRVGVGQVSPHGLGDKMRCYRQQRGRPFKADLQVILIPPLGQELISGPVDRNQNAQGLNELGGRYFPVVLGEVLAQVLGERKGLSVQQHSRIARLDPCPETFGQIFDQPGPVPAST